LTRVYRVLRQHYARSPFDGEGAYRYGGRWSSPGARLCYTSEHQSLAMLEYFVHLGSDDPPLDLVLAFADIPNDLSRQQVALSDLPAHWSQTPAPSALARIGDEFAERGDPCLLLVPSALAWSENNWLLNPLHPDFHKIKQPAPQPLRYDPRMFAERRRRRHKSK
jgi:RES domain-containing protein